MVSYIACKLTAKAFLRYGPSTPSLCNSLDEGVSCVIVSVSSPPSKRIDGLRMMISQVYVRQVCCPSLYSQVHTSTPTNFTIAASPLPNPVFWPFASEVY